MATKRLLILGATGGTGRQVVAQALERGFEVTALVRDASRAPAGAVRSVVGDVRDEPSRWIQVLQRQDAVISALGVGSSLKSGGLIAAAAPTLSAAMEREGVRRLVFTSAYGVGETRQDVPLLPRTLMRLLFGDLYRDKEAGERAVTASQLDWTVVYPVTLTNGPLTGRYRTGERLKLTGFPRIARADLAACLLALIDDQTSHRKRLLVASAP